MKKILVTKNPAKKLRSPPKSMSFRTFAETPLLSISDMLPPETTA